MVERLANSPARPVAHTPAQPAARGIPAGVTLPTVRRADKLMAIGTRLHLPIAVQTASSGREVMYSSVQIGFPDWAGVTDWQAAFPWFYCDENAGGNPSETDIANSGTVYGSLGISGTFTMGTFDGVQAGAMSANSWGRWCALGNPVYTPGGSGKIRSACQVALNATRPVGLSRLSGLASPEAYEWSATLDLTKIQTGGTVTNNITGYGYGPCLLIGRGNDGRLVPMIAGNSIDFSNDENTFLADARGNIGFWQRGFDDTTSNRRPYINFAVPGMRAGLQSSLLAGYFRRRAEILRSVATGVPFDFAVGGDENSALNDSTAWRVEIDNFADFINDAFGMPFAHRTMLPKVTYTNNHVGDTVADQTAAVDQRNATNTSLINTPNSARYAAKGPTFQIGEALHDSVSTTKWKAGAFSTTVAAIYAGSGAISLTASPPLGTILVFNAGTASVAVRTVTAVSGAGPYNVTCSTAPPSQAQGAAVASTLTDGDGVHPSTVGHRDLAAPVVVANKSNF